MSILRPPTTSQLRIMLSDCHAAAAAAADSIRWAFDVGAWKPSQEQWLRACTLVQPEELDRIRRFVYARDSKAAIVGRLLMRKMAAEVLGFRAEVSSSGQLFGRTDHGKPYLNLDAIDKESVRQVPAAFSFNVSHQGSYCILAAERHRPVGVDVTRMVYEGGKSVSEFFRLMRRQFTPDEWISINGPSKEIDRLSRFYRHWALKESYVKALGVGIGFDLQRVGFALNTELTGSTAVTDTALRVDRSATDWTFEESLLDNEHCAAVALGTSATLTSLRFADRSVDDFNEGPTNFQPVNFCELVRSLEPMRQPEPSLWDEFVTKPAAPC